MDWHFMQAAADGPGTTFLAEASELLTKEDFEGFLAKMLGCLELVLSKSTEKGARLAEMLDL